MRDLFLALVIFSLVPLAFMRPYIGVLMWIWLSLMVPQKLSWSWARLRSSEFMAFDLRTPVEVARVCRAATSAVRFDDAASARSAGTPT